MSEKIRAKTTEKYDILSDKNLSKSDEYNKGFNKSFINLCFKLKKLELNLLGIFIIDILN